jgi:hypothetical protein
MKECQTTQPCPVCYTDKLLTLEQYCAFIQAQDAMKDILLIERNQSTGYDGYGQTIGKLLKEMEADRLDRNHQLLKLLTGNERGFLPCL